MDHQVAARGVSVIVNSQSPMLKLTVRVVASHLDPPLAPNVIPK
jgi:hypothetical protein